MYKELTKATTTTVVQRVWRGRVANAEIPSTAELVRPLPSDAVARFSSNNYHNLLSIDTVNVNTKFTQLLELRSEIASIKNYCI